jgi:hypothetical protein
MRRTGEEDEEFRPPNRRRRSPLLLGEQRALSEAREPYPLLRTRGSCGGGDGRGGH